MFNNKESIIIFENKEVKLEVGIKDETVWLSLEQMADLFQRDRSVIGKHVRNIFKEGELQKDSVWANFAHTAFDDKVYQVDYYNLDVIISVGYRVKSRNGIVFRQWANKVLKEYLLEGYVVNNKRLEYLQKTVKLVDIASRINIQLDNNEAQEIIKVINNYSNAYNLLDDYDHRRIIRPKGNKIDVQVSYEDCIKVIDKLRVEFNSDLFALQRDFGLKTIIDSVYQTFDGKDLYPSVEEKAANFLYLIIKDHVFIDGNKRIAATLFIYFLQFHNLLYKNGNQIINNSTLVAITLLIAQSNPKEKEVLVDLIINFLLYE